MADMNFNTPSRGERLKRMGFLFKHTFTIVGRNTAIVMPVIRMMAYAIIMIAVMCAGIVLAFYENGNSTWFFLTGATLFIYKFFYYKRAELALSRLVYKVATGRNSTYVAERRELSRVKWQTRVLALFDMVSAWVAFGKNRKSGLVRMLLSGLVGIWDLVSNFLLPVFAIDRASLRDGIAELKRLKEHVPETLAGSFGVNIFAGMVGALMAPAYFFAIVAGIVTGFLFGAHMPEVFSAGTLGEWFPDLPQGLPVNAQTVFSWMPSLIIVFLGLIVHALVGRIVSAIKVSYFSLFYTRIAHADELAPDIRADLDDYLQFEGMTFESGSA